jgi:hypothetical protein
VLRLVEEQSRYGRADHLAVRREDRGERTPRVQVHAFELRGENDDRVASAEALEQCLEHVGTPSNGSMEGKTHRRTDELA